MIRHVGIILDGNRRFAAKSGKKPWEGHKAGADNLVKILPHLADEGVTDLTLYVFSTENFKREEEEKKQLFDLLKKYVSDGPLKKKLHELETSVTIAGDLTLFPKDVQDALHAFVVEFKQYTTHRLNLCLGYGGRDEIVRAVHKLLNADQPITEDSITRALDVPRSPDLIIRTGGSMRTSNFLPWQSIYSEWFFVDKFWPEITTADLDTIFDEFSKRKRNFGQ